MQDSTESFFIGKTNDIRKPSSGATEMLVKPTRATDTAREAEYEMAPILRQIGSRILGQTTLLAGRVLSRAFEGEDIDRYEFSTLAALEAFGPQSQAALGRRTNLDRSDVTAIVTALEAAQLVTRSPDAFDRRQKQVSLTKAGRAQFRRFKSRALKAQKLVFGALTNDEQQELFRLLLIVHDHLARQDGLFRSSA